MVTWTCKESVLSSVFGSLCPEPESTELNLRFSLRFKEKVGEQDWTGLWHHYSRALKGQGHPTCSYTVFPVAVLAYYRCFAYLLVCIIYVVSAVIVAYYLSVMHWQCRRLLNTFISAVSIFDDTVLEHHYENEDAAPCRMQGDGCFCRETGLRSPRAKSTNLLVWRARVLVWYSLEHR